MKLITTSIFLMLFLNVNAQNSKDDPVWNFELMWSEFNNRYANFELKEVDWQEVYDKYRPQINKKSTSDEVFDVCCKMLQELNDGHVTLSGKINGKKRKCNTVKYKVHLFEEFGDLSNFMAVTYKTLKKEQFSSLRPKISNGNLRHATSNDYGYLFIGQFNGFTTRKVDRIMKKAIKQFENKKGLIIDVRTNGGGLDKYCYQIAGRFADKKRLAQYEKVRIKGTQNFTELDSLFLSPKGEKQFTKPIVILTSNISASATEVFLLAMKELPYVTVIGNRTEGIFSDMRTLRFPNGWRVTLSHEQYFSADMINYEGIGIEPDIKILNYKKDEFDNVILKAIELLDDITKNK